MRSSSVLVLAAALLLIPVSAIRLKVEEDEDFVHPVMDMIQKHNEMRALHRPKPSNSTPAVKPEDPDVPPMTSATAQIYVINLKKRKDRWECARSQLAASAPYNYTRFEAVSANNVNKECPYLKKAWLAGGDPAKGVMCSNYKIWEEEVKNGHSDFVIIFEDDVAMGREMWDKIHDLFTGRCSNRFDYLVVDTFKGKGPERKGIKPEPSSAFCADASPGIGLHYIQGGGAQMQIVRRSALQKMLQLAEAHPDKPIDRLNNNQFNAANEIRGGIFQAHVAAQLKSAGVQGVHISDAAHHCSKSVTSSDIQGR